MPRLLTPLLLLALLVPATAASAGSPLPTPRTYRQQANAACQGFFEETAAIQPGTALSQRSWAKARPRLVSQLRRLARLSLQTDDQLARISRPAAVEQRWQRMLRADRHGAAVVLETADAVARTRTRSAGLRAFSHGFNARYDRAEAPFQRIARKLRLDGCLGLNPTADLGRDPSASRATRTAARAFGAIGSRLALASRAAAPAIEQNLKGLDSDGCGLDLAHAPRRVELVAAELFTAQFVQAVTGPLLPALTAADADLRAVHTTDPALQRGRQALRLTIAQARDLGPAVDACAALRTWQQTGYRADDAPKVAATVGQVAPSSQRELRAFGRRLRALGVRPAPILGLTRGPLSAGLGFGAADVTGP